MIQKPSLGVRFLLATISFILSFFLFVSAIGAMLILNVRTFTSKETLQNTIDQVVQENTEAIVDLAYDFLSEQMDEDIPISKEQVDTFLAESTIMDFLSEKVAATVDSVYNGSNAPIVTTEEVTELLQENAALMEEHFQIVVSDEQLQEITGWVEESGILDMLTPEYLQSLLSGDTSQLPGADDDITGDFGQSGGSSAAADAAPAEMDSLNAIMDSLQSGQLPSFAQLLEGARFLTSDTVLYTVIGIAVFMIALLMVVNIKQIHLGLIKSGIPVLIAGGLMLLPVALSSVISATVDKTVGNLVLTFISATIPIGATAAGIGLALIIGGIVVYSVRKSMARKAMLAAANETPVIVLSDNDDT